MILLSSNYLLYWPQYMLKFIQTIATFYIIYCNSLFPKSMSRSSMKNIEISGKYVSGTFYFHKLHKQCLFYKH